jgi:hypothetical protein
VKRISKHRPSSAMVVACISLFVAMGGVGYAAATIDSGDIINNTIRSADVMNGKLHARDLKPNTLGGGRIKESKLGKVPSAADADSLGGTAADGYLKSDARGVAVAGATIAADGTVRSWFNRAGGAPTVEDAGTGDYMVTFPGVSPSMDTHVGTSNLVGVAGLSTVDYSQGKVHVRTFSGNIAMDTWEADDRAFTVSLHAAGAAG